MTNIFTDIYPVRTNPCIHCGVSSLLELTGEEIRNLQAGLYIQTALPTRDAGFREQVKTGTHPACWDAIFADDED